MKKNDTRAAKILFALCLSLMGTGSAGFLFGMQSRGLPKKPKKEFPFIPAEIVGVIFSFSAIFSNKSLLL